MEDIEYTTCVPFAVIVAEELEERPVVRRRAVEPTPWVMQEEGEA